MNYIRENYDFIEPRKKINKFKIFVCIILSLILSSNIVFWIILGTYIGKISDVVENVQIFLNESEQCLNDISEFSSIIIDNKDGVVDFILTLPILDKAAECTIQNMGC